MALDHTLIGKTYPTITYEMGREKIREFARAVSDPNPLYHDLDYARATSYGELVAPPSMAAQYGILVAETYLWPDPAIAPDYPFLLYAGHDFQYFAVVRAGDTLRVTGQIKDIYEKGRLQFLVFQTEVQNQRDERVLLGTATYAIRPHEEAGQ